MSSPSLPSPAIQPRRPVEGAAGAEAGATAPPIQLVRHGRPPLLLLLRIGQVRQLFDAHSFWAQNRPRRALARMLLGSCSVVSAWQAGRLVGFGRATSDGMYRAVLWDVVVASEQQGQGLGSRIVQALIASPPVATAERIYLMTTNSSGFYARLGFTDHHGQQLLVLYRKR